MTFSFSGPVWYWRGPAPFYFVTAPEAIAKEIKAHERMATYGWGMIPVEVVLGGTTWTTSLWPKDGLYVVPLKDAVRKAEHVQEGDEVDLLITILLERGKS